MSKAPSPNNASPETANLGPCDMENPPSSESAEHESTKTTPPNNPSDGIGTAGEDSTGGDSAQPQTQSLPRLTPLVVETLANDPDFIQAGFHIGRFITAVINTQADWLNYEALMTEVESCVKRIFVSSHCIIVHCLFC
jgi:hypothetical protein